MSYSGWKLDMKKIRRKLNLTDEPYKFISDDLLSLAFISKSGSSQLDSRTIAEYLDKYGRTDYEHFEFLGDAILELIVTQFLSEHLPDKNPYYQSKYRETIVQNIVLYCKMQAKNLCSSILAPDNYPWKICADVHESIIGVIYYYLTSVIHRTDAFDLIYHWYIKTWDLKSTVDSVVLTGNISCTIDGRYGQWSSWSSCDHGRQIRTRKCDNPYPWPGGKQCPGPLEESRPCVSSVESSDRELFLSSSPLFSSFRSFLSNRYSYTSRYRLLEDKSYRGHIIIYNPSGQIDNIYTATSSSISHLPDLLINQVISHLPDSSSSTE